MRVTLFLMVLEYLCIYPTYVDAGDLSETAMQQMYCNWTSGSF